jgi:hypothetical protein
MEQPPPPSGCDGGDGDSASDSDGLSEGYVTLAAYSSTLENCLTFDVGLEVVVLSETNEQWWYVEIDGVRGYAPVNHLGPRSALVEQGGSDYQDAEYYDAYARLSTLKVAWRMYQGALLWWINLVYTPPSLFLARDPH